MLVLEDLVGFFIDPFNFSFFSFTGRGTDLDYYDTEWFSLERNREILRSFLRLHPSTAFQTFVDYDGYSTSSMGFLPTVVEVMVI